MTLLTIAQGMAKKVGLEVPDRVVGSSAREMLEVLEHANDAGEELARRVDWGVLNARATLTGDGTNKEHTLPSGYSRLVRAASITVSGVALRPLTRPEWNGLTAVEGTPRYFLLEGSTVTLWPYLANAATATASYQTEFWCSNGAAAWTADDETSLIDENLFQLCVEVRWRRQKGMDYADLEAEYEAKLTALAGFDDRGRL